MSRVPRRLGSLIEAAAVIAQDLDHRAYCRDGRVTWMGRTPAEGGGGPNDPVIPTVAALGPELYSGTSGIALFLAEVAAQTGEHRFADLAQGGIKQSIARSSEMMEKHPFGLFVGGMGIGYASVRVGLCLKDNALVEHGVAMMLQAADKESADALDVIGGNAGAVPALFSLSRRLHRSELAEAAIRLSDDIRSEAQRDERGTWWDNGRATGSSMGPDPLTGYAHGSAGMSLALLEAGAYTGSRDYVEVAVDALRYEDSCFDENTGSWYDLREWVNQGRPDDAPKLSSVAWCHGAPGIGLARMRAERLGFGYIDAVRNGLARAIETVSARLDELKRPLQQDFTPCHGIAGLGELVLEAGRAGDKARLKQATLLAFWLADAIADGQEIRSGTPSSEHNPSLMLGNAGVGLFLLRVATRGRVPAVLIPDA